MMQVEEATSAIEIEHHEMLQFAGIKAKGGFDHASSFLSTSTNFSCTISYSTCAKVYLFFFITVTCVPLIAGGAFTSIFIEDKNINGAVSAFFTACFSLGTLSLFILHLVGKLEKYHDRKTLSGLKLLGMIGSLASGTGLGVYTILAFLKKQSFSYYGANYFSSAVFSSICLVTSLELYIVAQWYQNALFNIAGRISSNSRRNV